MGTLRKLWGKTKKLARGIFNVALGTAKEAVTVEIKYPEKLPPQQAGFDTNMLIPIGMFGIIIFLLLKK